MSPTHDRLTELWQKIDAFFARARAAHRASITCASGCDACCHRRFSVTALEADALRAHLATLDASTRAALRERALHGDKGRCAALDARGRCDAYAARPVICRTHGLALRFRDDARSLPLLDACPKNYEGVALDGLDPATVLDQTTLSTILAALDAAHADAAGAPRGRRVDLDEVFATG